MEYDQTKPITLSKLEALQLACDTWAMKEVLANKEIERLKEENARVWELHNDFLNNKMTTLQKEVHNLRSENVRYQEALEFYADLDNWKKSNVDNASKIHGDDVEHIVGMLLHRGGRRAREALKGE